jgi:ribonuclease HII
MFVYAGIDEAGYGPLFGPLVIARSIFILDRHEPTLEPPSLWNLLSSTVCKKPSDKKRRLAINDSKKLYKPPLSMEHLERGAFAFLSTCGIVPGNLDDLLENLAYDLLSHQINQAWYHSSDGEPRVPLFYSPSQLEFSGRKLNSAMLKKSMRLVDVKAAVVFEDRFNQMVRAMRSKASCAWVFVSGHLQAIWSEYGDHNPLVIIDRQGGRKNYGELLESIFVPAQVSTLHENPRQSGYRIVHGDRRMAILFQVDSERRHLPVALASMTAKYLRELLLTRFQAYWSARAPGVRPTFGYFGDGRRFLREIQPLVDQLGIDPESLIRCC